LLFLRTPDTFSGMRTIVFLLLLAILRDTVRRSMQITKITPPRECRWK
jgi:hypothetical protein